MEKKLFKITKNHRHYTFHYHYLNSKNEIEASIVNLFMKDPEDSIFNEIYVDAPWELWMNGERNRFKTLEMAEAFVEKKTGKEIIQKEKEKNNE